ncbi:LysR family transcriptional regulator, partial [bacterium LRH843]|nr:LysR family transcriptional regulator [bacterium LRH843]
RLPPLNWIRAFEASARHSSFAAAARELNLTATAISHQIRSLEQQIGHPLFERRARSVRLTGMGASYLPEVRKALER